MPLPAPVTTIERLTWVIVRTSRFNQRLSPFQVTDLGIDEASWISRANEITLLGDGFHKRSNAGGGDRSVRGEGLDRLQVVIGCFDVSLRLPRILHQDIYGFGSIGRLIVP